MYHNGCGNRYNRHIAGVNDHLTHVLMDDCLMRRNEDTTGFAAGRFCIFVDIGVNSTSDAHRQLWQVVNTHGIGNSSDRLRKLSGECDVGIVIHTHRIKLDFQMFHIV